MPRTGKKKTGNNFDSYDVTLNDSANCEVSVRRLPKPVSNAFAKMVNISSGAEYHYEEWPENQFEDGISSSLEVSPKKCFSPERNFFPKTGINYPLDIWFLLGEYIKPEDVSLFARICKRSLYVVSTYKFWICLYKRYYKSSCLLPDCLLPIRIEHPYSIKVNVVRALHHFYPPFLQRRANAATRENEINSLMQLRCIALWHNNLLSGKWTFFFKFCRPQQKKTVKRISWTKESWEDAGEGDQHTFPTISANPEEGFYILCIKSTNFFAASPKLLGRRLADFKLTLCNDMRSHCIRLTFSSSSYVCRNSKDRSSKGDLMHLDIEPVESVQVFRWWHPHYPHPWQ